MSGLQLYTNVSEYDPEITEILPFNKVYSIQVRNEVFTLSGLSLSSDGPSYFTNHFLECGNSQVLYVDRDPNVFSYISRYLQGYHIETGSAALYALLWQDSLYFNLSRLQSILNKENHFAVVGGKSFLIPKSLLSKYGNEPNFFSIQHNTILEGYSTLIKNRTIKRPVPLQPISIPNRSPAIFDDLLEVLRGNTMVIKNDQHRDLLMKEARYYRFLETEQRMVKHRVVNNPFSVAKQDIIINIDDVRPEGVFEKSRAEDGHMPIQYLRPYLYKEPTRELIFELRLQNERYRDYSEPLLMYDRNTGILILKVSHTLSDTFRQLFGKHIDAFTTESSNPNEPYVSFLVEKIDCKTTLNGMNMKKGWFRDLYNSFSETSTSSDIKKRRVDNSYSGNVIKFVLKRSLWKLLVWCGKYPKLQAIQLEAVTDESSLYDTNIDFL